MMRDKRSERRTTYYVDSRTQEQQDMCSDRFSVCSYSQPFYHKKDAIRYANKLFESGEHVSQRIWSVGRINIDLVTSNWESFKKEFKHAIAD